MPAKLRSKSQINKLTARTQENQGCSAEQHPWFSFKYLTTNRNYTLYGLSQGRERELILWGLFDRLEELTHRPWLYWTQQPKRTGLETISYDQLNFEADSSANLSKDTTIYIFRFDTHLGNNQGRIIGFKKSPCAVFHIIGYDLDFSAYRH